MGVQWEFFNLQLVISKNHRTHGNLSIHCGLLKWVYGISALHFEYVNRELIYTKATTGAFLYGPAPNFGGLLSHNFQSPLLNAKSFLASYQLTGSRQRLKNLVNSCLAVFMHLSIVQEYK